ncbi:MAG: penicillin acylase family protein [Ignavibacteria bacterium]|nr:penicillin acylase family protein [Ignavibacteria bacterium]
MNKFAKTFLGLLVIVIPSILILGLLFNNLSQKSFYPTTGEIAVSGIKSPVKVYFDKYGVPHVLAKDEDDAFFTQGYLHARDRLWQMDLTRRVAEGRLSEIFGSGTMNFDKMFRTIGIHRFAYNWYNNISPKSKQMLTAYTLGVNKFIETHYDNLPVEFDALNYRPEPWKPEHSLMLARMMAWDLNIAWYTDYIIGELVNKTGLEKTSEIFPDSNITIFKNSPSETEESDSIETKRKETGSTEQFRMFAALGKGIFEINESYRKFLGLEGSHIGSNSWVVSSQKSITGKPILANDPHLALQAPSRWYEIYIKGGELDVQGMSFPGVPSVVIGNNKFIAWGLTNLMNDDNDFIILNRDSAGNKYVYENKSYELDSIKEKIYVKDSLETEYVVRLTKIGPVVSDLNIRGFADFQPKSNDPYEDKLMTLRWTGYELSDELNCFYGINTAKNWDEFENALKNFGAPAQNFTYADVYGNIGYQAAGKIPIRKTLDNNSYVYPSDADLDWTGFIDFEKMPSVYNPKEGYIVTANTNPFSWIAADNSKEKAQEKFYISYLWESDSRFNRISNFLRSRSLFDMDDFRLLQNNIESPYAANLSRHLIMAYDSLSVSDDNIKWCVDRFRSWNGEMKAGESIASVYNTFLVYLLKNIYEDELGKDVFRDFLIVQNIPYRSLELILNQSDNPWFDNVNTSQKEYKNEILRRSLEQAIEFLKLKFTNQDINTWHWGQIHNVKFRHPLGLVDALDKTFNIGPYEIGGDQTTVNNTEFSFNEVIEDGKFSVVIGASMRRIVSLSAIEHPLSINSTGQSGQPVNDNYSDQAKMWLYGEYKTNTSSEIEMLDKRYELLTLTPIN